MRFRDCVPLLASPGGAALILMEIRDHNPTFAVGVVRTSGLAPIPMLNVLCQSLLFWRSQICIECCRTWLFRSERCDAVGYVTERIHFASFRTDSLPYT